LANYRKQLGLPPAGSETDKLTIAKLEISNCAFFGINSNSDRSFSEEGDIAAATILRQRDSGRSFYCLSVFLVEEFLVLILEQFNTILA